MFDAYSAGDVEGFVACWDPDAEWTTNALGTLEGRPRSYRGHDGLRSFHTDVNEALAGMSVRATDFRDLGDKVIVLGALAGAGAASGAPFEQSAGWVFEIRGGRIVSGRDFLDQAEALRTAEPPNLP